VVALVGRSAPLAVIDEALAAATAGRGGLVLVTGESGIGKTSLAEAARLRAAACGLRVAHGYAVDDPGTPVLWPWRRVGARIPELEGILATLTLPDLDDDAVRFGVSEAVAEELRRAAGTSGLLILLEDLHWADSLSVALLRHVAYDLASSPVLVVVTARDDPATPFGRTLPDLVRGSAATSVPLRGLTAHEVSQWLASDSGTAPWCPLADDLVARADGNPFYIRVLTSEAPPPSGRLDDVLAERSAMRGLLVAPLLRLTEDARRTIATAALMSERLSPTLLAAATGRTVSVVSDHIAAATRVGLLQHGPTGLSFVHALVRDAVVAHTDPQERAAAEAAIAAAMEATGDPLLVGPSAAHWDRAGTSEASMHCRDGARAAAAQAATARAHEEAVAFARMSLRHARRLGSEGADLAERLVELARYEWMANLVPDAIASCVEAVDVAEAAGRADLMAEAALVPQGIGSLEVARAADPLCLRALALLPEDAVAERARLLSLRAVAAAEEAVDGTADPLSALALDLARRSGSAQAELEAIAARHYVLSYPQAIAERTALVARAVDLGRGSTTAMGGLWGHLWLSDIAMQRGDLGALDRAIEQIDTVAADRSSPVGRWHAHRLRALRAAVTGAFDEARREAEAGLRIAERAGDLSMVGMYSALRIQLALVRGDPGEVPEEAVPLLERAPPIPILRASFAQVLVLLEQRDRAAAILETLRDLPERMPVGPRWMATVGQIGLAGVALGDADLARCCHTLLAPTAHWYAADGGGAPFFHGSNEYPVGMLALGAGEIAVAAGHFERGVAANLRLGAHPFVALSRLRWAQCLSRGARSSIPARPTAPTEAAPPTAPSGPSPLPSVRALAEAAAEELRALDMPGPLAEARRLLTGLPPHGDPGPLTARELEVARLVADARTNQQIADHLFVSVRTVESHVRSALAKLGFSTRTELALWVRDEADR
jgi:DNA-binding CsgD family transcriptional regulator